MYTDYRVVIEVVLLHHTIDDIKAFAQHITQAHNNATFDLDNSSFRLNQRIQRLLLSIVVIVNFVIERICFCSVVSDLIDGTIVNSQFTLLLLALFKVHCVRLSVLL